MGKLWKLETEWLTCFIISSCIPRTKNLHLIIHYQCWTAFHPLIIYSRVFSIKIIVWWEFIEVQLNFQLLRLIGKFLFEFRPDTFGLKSLVFQRTPDWHRLNCATKNYHIIKSINQSIKYEVFKVLSIFNQFRSNGNCEYAADKMQRN